LLRGLRKNYLWGNSCFFPLSIHIFLITKQTTQDALRYLPLFLFKLTSLQEEKTSYRLWNFFTCTPYKFVVTIIDLIGTTRIEQRLLKGV
jgi:hypothetical protein